MVATHKVKINGKWYGLGEKIPGLAEPPITTESKTEVQEEVQEEKNTLTKTEIKRMPTAELQVLAKKNGVGNADSLTGAELKEILIKKFNL